MPATLANLARYAVVPIPLRPGGTYPGDQAGDYLLLARLPMCRCLVLVGFSRLDGVERWRVAGYHLRGVQHATRQP